MRKVGKRLDWSIEKIRAEAVKVSNTYRVKEKDERTIHVEEIFAERAEKMATHIVVKYVELFTGQAMVRSMSILSLEGQLMASRLIAGCTYKIESTRLHNGYWSWTDIQILDEQK